ncbi:MAG: hypothetical protein H6996_06835 [Moraxellaceae bacterium]|nr:hypothetical protein [Pseudomonadales bacterium]MCB1673081.1 hypothetical protein [Pseudomonadales bacterium]MCP5174801.1 hypothetical protein [Moraxellaceae bacterium]HQV21685.1 hypothetical protein [Agitococcus sp.]
MPYLRYKLGFAIICGSLIANAALAADDSSVGKRLYRYYNDKGIPTMSDQITDEHIRRGYDIVDRNMQVIRHFPPFDEAVYQKDKAKRDSAFKQQQEDARILRLFSSARDAELARNRQLDTLETSIGYNNLQLQRIKRLRATFVAEAAATERTTKKADPKVQGRIAEFDKQILDLQTLINYQRIEKSKVTNDFVPIIKRLSELEKIEESKGSIQFMPSKQP